MSDKLIRFGDSARVKKKLDVCRHAGMTITENVLTGVTRAMYGDEQVLACKRKGPNQWVLEYTEIYWEEFDVPTESDDVPTTQTTTLKGPIQVPEEEKQKFDVPDKPNFSFE